MFLGGEDIVPGLTVPPTSADNERTPSAPAAACPVLLPPMQLPLLLPFDPMSVPVLLLEGKGLALRSATAPLLDPPPACPPKLSW